MPDPGQTQELPAAYAMSIATTARRYDSSIKTVRRWLDRGLPFLRSGARTKILIRPEDVERFLQRRCHAQVDVNVMVENVMKELTDRPAAHIRQEH